MPLKVRTEKQKYEVIFERDGDRALFVVSPLTPEQLMKIMAKNRSYEWERNQRFEKVDFYGAKLDKIDAVILDWDGLADENGEPIPCSKEYKLVLAEQEPDLVDWVLEQAEAMAKRWAEDKKDIQKN